MRQRGHPQAKPVGEKISGKEGCVPVKGASIEPATEEETRTEKQGEVERGKLSP